MNTNQSIVIFLSILTQITEFTLDLFFISFTAVIIDKLADESHTNCKINMLLVIWYMRKTLNKDVSMYHQIFGYCLSRVID